MQETEITKELTHYPNQTVIKHYITFLFFKTCLNAKILSLFLLIRKVSPLRSQIVVGFTIPLPMESKALLWSIVEEIGEFH